MFKRGMDEGEGRWRTEQQKGIYQLQGFYSIFVTFSKKLLFAYKVQFKKKKKITGLLIFFNLLNHQPDNIFH